MTDSQLYTGDMVTVLRTLPTPVADLVVTSPPYNLAKDYGRAVSDDSQAVLAPAGRRPALAGGCMSAHTKIAWAHHTFNPWWGCQRVSAACEYCYAETFAKRLGYAVWGPPATTPRRMASAQYWQAPYTWNAAAQRAGERHRVFCASMADVFEDHPDVAEARAQLWQTIDATPFLDWLLLTKRPENLVRFLPPTGTGRLRRNVWLGTTVEHQAAAAARIPHLLVAPAVVHFLSCEPLLGPLDLMSLVFDRRTTMNVLEGVGTQRGGIGGQTTPNVTLAHTITWVIAGGESGGPAERRLVEPCLFCPCTLRQDCPRCDGTRWQRKPAAVAWARALRDQCQAVSTPFFWKQWGGPRPTSGGRLLDGRTWDEVPVVVAQP